jgi:TatD DNase family protein
MPFFTDTHVHFDGSSAATAASVQRALAAGVNRLMAVGGSAELNAAAIAAARSFPGPVRLALGWDREQAGKISDFRFQISDLNQEPGTKNEEPAFSLQPLAFRLPPDLPLAAIGEIGLDYHYHPDTQAAQCELFAEMLRLAAARNLPAIIHTREADDDSLRMLDEAGSRAQAAAGRLGVVHCFTGGEDFARALLDRGLYLSFSGILTFRNADMLRGAARFVPADRLLIETDSPFLAPVPKRGQRNEPAFVVHVAELLATLRGVTLEELADQTNRNAERLFGAW